MWYKPNYVKKLALNSQLPTVQILTNDVQVLILCLSYFITTVAIGAKYDTFGDPGCTYLLFTYLSR